MIPADETLRGLLKAHLDDHDLIANLASYGRRMHFMKAFAHYEVFKLIEDIPGDIVECGVYKGASLLTFARFLETFCPGDRTRKVLGFDHFKGLADRTDKDGLDARVGNTAEGWNPSQFRDTLTVMSARRPTPMWPNIRAFGSPCFIWTWICMSRRSRR
jgi:hypothetical protein